MAQSKWPKRKNWRPTRLTPKVAQSICEIVKDGVSPEIAAAAAGIGRTAYYDWRSRGRVQPDTIYADFNEMLEQALAECEARAARVVVNAFPDSWQAAMTLLERRFPDRWGRRERVDIYEHQRVRQEAERIAARFNVPVEQILQRAGVALPSPN